MASVSSLGYLGITATDLDAWKEFAVDVHGMQAVEHTDDRLLLRIDERSWRLDIRRGDADDVDTIGWEVQGPADLAEFAQRLTDGGFPTTPGSAELIEERKVTDLVSFKDPSGNTIELFYGQKRASAAFVSPTGARFVTGDYGLGHVMQFVDDSSLFRKLYMELLGFQLSDFIDIGPDPGTFLHCNPRHHSIAFANLPGTPARMGHLMIQVDDMDTVGRAYDWVLKGGAKLGSTLGKHTNDEMLSYYVKTPSGFEIEYGYGGLLIDDDTWVPGRWDAAHFWGHDRGGSVLPG